MITKNHFASIIASISFIIITYILYLIIFVATSPKIGKPPYFIIAISTLFILIFLTMNYFSVKNNIIISNKLFIVTLIIYVILPRMLWIYAFKTIPNSDFLVVNNYAIAASKGLYSSFDISYKIFPYKLGFPLFLSIFYWIFGGSLIIAKLLNVFISVCIAYCIYRIGNVIFNNSTGRFASIIFALWPSQIMFCSVIASEHLFILLLLLAIVFFIEAIQKFEKKIIKSTTLIITGIFISLAHFVRPFGLLIVIVFILFIIMFHVNEPKYIMKIIPNIILIFFGFFSGLFVLSTVCEPLVKVPLFKSNFGFSLLIGTNLESSGMYNNKDMQIIKKYNYDPDMINDAAIKIALNRLTLQPGKYLKSLPDKLLIMWGTDDYGYYWSTSQIGTMSTIQRYKLNLKYLSICQYYYIECIFFVLIGCFYILKNNIYVACIFLLIFLAFFATHIFLEVQSRYHYPIIALLIIVAGYGFEQFSIFFMKYLSSKQ